MMVADEGTVNLFGFYSEKVEAFFELIATESLIDKNLHIGCFKKRCVAAAPCPKVGNCHRHVNGQWASREGLEHTDAQVRERRILGHSYKVQNDALSEHRSIILISNLSKVKLGRSVCFASVDIMRRSQTTLLTTLAVVASLLFMSQFPTISSVSNIHPDDTTQTPPPNTDTDGDLIPDVHETLFEEWMNWTSVDGREVIMEGLDKNDGSDASADRDRDGLNATEEFCWPYPANCTDSGFARGLTGVLDENSERIYLDPRVSDTDGDGLPDGFEAYMCQRTGGFDQMSMRYSCMTFDPLNASDLVLDGDNDGFDVDRDGVLSPAERFTAPEEYRFGAPANHTMELDGLWCHATLPEGSPLKNWPFIPSGVNASFHNLLPACTTNSTTPVGEDLWLGTDPLLDDSDRYYWDGFSIRPLYPSFGDGIPDGWEAHFGLNPLNRTNALDDPDQDGWDENRDGVITPDLARTETALKLGESLSTLQEYLVHYDDGNTVYPGLKHTALGDGGEYEQVPLVYDAEEDESSILHHDIRALEVDDEHLYVVTRYGSTVFDTGNDITTHHWMPQGIEVHDGHLVHSNGAPFAMAFATSAGFALAPLLADGSYSPISSWDWVLEGEMHALEQLAVDDGNPYVIALGPLGTGSVHEINLDGSLVSTFSIGQGIRDALETAEANVTSIQHGSVGGSTLTLFVGTDRGLLTFETPSARDEALGSWRFFYTPGPSPIPTSIDEIRSLSLGTVGNPAEVRTMVLDGPSAANAQVLWFGTPSGLHKFELLGDDIFHSGLLAHPGIDGQSARELNDIHAIYPTGDELLIGSQWGLWGIVGDYTAVYGLQDQTWLPGQITTIQTISSDGNVTVFGGAAPGMFANLQLIDPGANDSDADGMPDGWEVYHGLDPTDPWDALYDSDGDGIDLDQSGDFVLERLWTNLDEFRYVERTMDGYNSTNPTEGDSDGDGLSDGAEYFGFFYENSTLWCHYTVQLVYVCDDAAGQSANATYLNVANIDQGTDPTNHDSDGDGMPDGWEIEHRRWVGTSFSGGNNWSLDPLRADDADWDADGDGLANLCEYQWSLVRMAGIRGDLLADFGESAESASTWAAADPNNIDSDGDSLPDGWESAGYCTWTSDRIGVNPLNGSDAFENPDGDGYDIDHDGILSLNESFVNYLEYHLRSDLFSGNQTLGGVTLPEGFTTNLFDDVGAFGEPEATFAERASGSVTVTQSTYDIGAANPLSADTDDDGMPDGWEIWFARWNLLDDEWTLNPLDSTDRWEDADEDGMTNWEEYNSIAPQWSETDVNRSSPQWFVTTIGQGYALQQWPGISTSQSFGSFLIQEQINLTGWTTDPNNIDTDGDGMLDGVELLFTAWNVSAQTWTLNPLVAGDGDFDGDEDGLIDRQEFGLSIAQPDNGGLHPSDAPLMHIDGDLQQPTEKAQRVFNILISKDTRGKRLLNDFNSWQQGEPPNAFLEVVMGMTDPTISDTDGDGMYDGFEYWFSSWDLEENRWSMNPLIDGDVNLDTDGDSFDCNGDGEIDVNETFSNLREWESRTWGNYLNRNTVPASEGIIDFGEDAMSAYQEELGFNLLQAQQALYLDFIKKGTESESRMDKINSNDGDNFNRSLRGVADPTHHDSDSDGIPDGWEYCYAIYGMEDLSTINHWAANPLNPWDVDYDGDRDGWYDRTSFDTPAVQGIWDNRVFTPSGQTIQNGLGDLPFTNFMEYDNQTRPDLNDSDADSRTYNTVVENGLVIYHELDYNYSDGREVFKYGSNPSDNDTDGDMLPDWYEYKKAWNETHDNFSSFVEVRVVWIDAATGGSCDTATNSCLPLSQDGSGGSLGRPDLEFTWFTLDPTDPDDANEDPDQDGNWDCSGAGCNYEPYTNFQEFYAVTVSEYSSPNAVRLSGLTYQGNPVQEGWQFRASILGLGQSNELLLNYLKLDQYSGPDRQYGYIVNDYDTDFLTVDPNDDVILMAGNLTDAWEIYYQGSPNTPPVRNVGEHEFGWYLLDLDDDHLAEGSDPMNWDTDGDWMVDWFEVHDDEEDGVRGDSSPIRYDSRQTN